MYTPHITHMCLTLIAVFCFITFLATREYYIVVYRHIEEECHKIKREVDELRKQMQQTIIQTRREFMQIPEKKVKARSRKAKI
jgi:hypothetical protein